MVKDKLLIFDDDLALSTLSVATVLSTYVCDLTGGVAKDAWGTVIALPKPGRGGNLWFNFIVTATAASSGSGTLNAVLSTGAVNTLATTLWSSGVLAAATLVAGYKYAFTVPEACLRWIGMQWIVGTNVFQSGTVLACLSTSPIDWTE